MHTGIDVHSSAPAKIPLRCQGLAEDPSVQWHAPVLWRLLDALLPAPLCSTLRLLECSLFHVGSYSTISVALGQVLRLTSWPCWSHHVQPSCLASMFCCLMFFCQENKFYLFFTVYFPILFPWHWHEEVDTGPFTFNQGTICDWSLWKKEICFLQWTVTGYINHTFWQDPCPGIVG